MHQATKATSGNSFRQHDELGTRDIAVYLRPGEQALDMGTDKIRQGGRIEEYDFGGYATGQLGDELRGINEFKAGFGGHQVEKYSYYKSYSKSYTASKSIYLGALSAGQKIKG